MKSWWIRTRVVVLSVFAISMSACTQYQTYNQSTGFMAPEEHLVSDPVTFCELQVSISDPRYSSKDISLVQPILTEQMTKYINADGRLKIERAGCKGSLLSVDFTNITDLWDKELDTQLYTVKANSQVKYKELDQTFYEEEESGQKEFMAHVNLHYGSSVRNRTRFMDKWITKVDAMVRSAY